MKTVHLTCLVLLVCASSVFAQTATPQKDAASTDASAPLTVDVHASPYRPSVFYTTNTSHGRFDMRNATVLDLIEFAWGREESAVLGGPTWIDLDRFDLAAKISALEPITSKAVSSGNVTPPATLIRPALQRVLTERFGMKYHMEDKSLPGYEATVAKEGAKLTQAAAPAAPNSCQGAQDPETHTTTLTCTSETVTQFFATYGGIYPHPVVDHTGLTKAYDFALKLDMSQIRSMEDQTRVFDDAFHTQLGIVVTAGSVTQPAMVVDMVERPTPNPSEIAKLIPATPDLEFEVASIRPAADNEPHDQSRPAGSQITFSSYSVQELLTMAFQLPTGAMLGNRPTWLDQTRYTVLVKLPPGVDGFAVFQDHDLIASMMQKLMVDRFQIKYHWGDQQQDEYVLYAGTPKMKKADPNSRTFCRTGPPPGEKDWRTAKDSPYDHEFYCQNVTMAQFADMAEAVSFSEVKNRVPDKTGLAGSYDFTLYYTSGHKVRVDAQQAQAAAKQTGEDTADPVVALPVEDAYKKLLGLRLQKETGSVPALILDHIEQTPTEN